MAKIAQFLTSVDSVAVHSLGEKYTDPVNGDEFIYLLGVASTAANDLVTFDEAFATTRSTANAVGACAIAMAATVADKYGWYQIYGAGTVATAAAVADNKALYLTSTAGAIDDADVAGDAIIGLWSRGTATGAGTVACQLNYPMVHDIAID
jgi:hypothetical protein